MPRDPDEQPDFRTWANDAENAVEADALIADFLADEGVEMVSDLLGCGGQQHQWTAERWMNRLADRFRRWWADGCPRLATGRRVALTYLLSSDDQEARRLLDASLPPGATFSLVRRMRKAVSGNVAGHQSEPAGIACKIDDGEAMAMGQGETMAAAAGRAIESWREFVTASRAQVEEAELVGHRPPLIDAPSADAASRENQGQAGKQAG